MEKSKNKKFTTNEVIIAQYARALAHPARIAILRLLLKKQSCICGSIVNELPLSQSTVSQHLKELKKAGLIKGNVAGVTICYCIDKKVWERANKVLQELFTSKLTQSKCC
jgi:ArsR family transcriptional regulator